MTGFGLKTAAGAAAWVGRPKVNWVSPLQQCRGKHSPNLSAGFFEGKNFRRPWCPWGLLEDSCLSFPTMKGPLQAHKGQGWCDRAARRPSLPFFSRPSRASTSHSFSVSSVCTQGLFPKHSSRKSTVNAGFYFIYWFWSLVVGEIVSGASSQLSCWNPVLILIARD